MIMGTRTPPACVSCLYHGKGVLPTLSPTPGDIGVAVRAPDVIQFFLYGIEIFFW